MTPLQEDKQSNEKMGKGPEQTFLQGGDNRGPRDMKGCSASLAIREMQVKITVRYHFTLVIVTKSTNSAGKAVEKREP